LIEKLQKLPPQRQAEVRDFVEFLAAREERAAAGERLGESLAGLDALNLPRLSDEEIEAEIQAARQDRIARPANLIVRVVLDTNTLVSGIISPGGPPRRLLVGARRQIFELCSSATLLAELLDVLAREKFSIRLAQAGLSHQGIVVDLRRLAHMATPQEGPRVIEQDADDDHVIACAVAGQAGLVVSGDKHLHSLGGQYQGIPIVTATEAVQRILAG